MVAPNSGNATPSNWTWAPAGVGQRAQDVEHGTDAYFPSHRSGVTHCGVEGLGEHVAYADFVDATGDRLGSKLDVCSQGLQNIGAAAGTGGGAVAVFGYFQPGPRGDKGGGGGDVEGVAAVAAGTDSVDQRPVHFHSQGELTHDAGHAGEFPGGLALQPQCGEEGAKLGRGGLPLHDLPHHRRCIGHVEGTPGHYFVDCFTDIQGYCSKKV